MDTTGLNEFLVWIDESLENSPHRNLSNVLLPEAKNRRGRRALFERIQDGDNPSGPTVATPEFIKTG